MSTLSPTTIIGGGLAGCEAAWALARRGCPVHLFEMRPKRFSPAHHTDRLGELVCSNSFRSKSEENAVGILKREMLALHSLVMEAALVAQVPAGDALGVDRDKFSAYVTEKISNEPRIKIFREEVSDLAPLLEKGRVIVATGPLTSEALIAGLQPYIGSADLYFYDAIAPIIDASTIDLSVAFRASRYGRGESEDYLNCPLDEHQYFNFVRHLRKAQKVMLRPFEEEKYFEACLPIEVMADRGEMTLAFGPMKPVGLIDPRTGKQPFAVVQLRMENANATAFNMVGFQTKLTYAEQKRIFRFIPGLEQAEFFRMGSIHRNTFINAPRLLNGQLQLKKFPNIYFAGQLTGTEGYVESSALGVLVGLLVAGETHGKPLALPPQTTSFGAMVHHLTQASAEGFQPMHVNFGIFPPLAENISRKDLKAMGMTQKEYKKKGLSLRARDDFAAWLKASELSF